MSDAERDYAASLLASERHELLRRSADPALVEARVNGIVDHLQQAMHCIPFDLVVESSLHQDMPVLSAGQFETYRFQAQRRAQKENGAWVRQLLPKALRRVLDALIGAHYLFQDELFHHTTAYSAPYAQKDGWDLAQKLLQHFNDRWPGLGPGGHYDLVDEFASMLGLEGWYHWETIPSLEPRPEPPPRRDQSPPRNRVSKVALAGPTLSLCEGESSVGADRVKNRP